MQMKVYRTLETRLNLLIYEASCWADSISDNHFLIRFTDNIPYTVEVLIYHLLDVHVNNQRFVFVILVFVLVYEVTVGHPKVD